MKKVINKVSRKEINKYLDLPYTYIIQKVNDESGEYYFANVLELDGCMSDGETFEDAYKNIREAMSGWIETKLAYGFEIPLPKSNDYSGKFVIRMPKSLHQKLVIEAEKEGVSLNQLALYKLAL